MRDRAFLNKNIRIYLLDKTRHKEKKESFHYEGGIEEFVEFLAYNKAKLIKKNDMISII